VRDLGAKRAAALLLAAALAGLGTVGVAAARALASRDDPGRLDRLAVQAVGGRDPLARLAISLLSAAEDAAAERAYGLACLRTWPLEPALGRSWLARAARRGDPRSAFALALSLRSGESGERKAAEAIPWLERAAQRGIGAAHFLLANAYRYGDGVDVDLRRAIGHYEEAAEREDAPAIQALAEAYRSGELGLPRDPERAELLMRELDHAVREPRPAL
jgi:TPR repeat protein